MKKFMAVYLGSASAFEKSEWGRADPERLKVMQAVGMQAWSKWVMENRDAIVDMGAPLGKTRSVSQERMAEASNMLTAYVIVEAASHEAAAEMFENHPHFSVLAGEHLLAGLDLPSMGYVVAERAASEGAAHYVLSRPAV